MIIDSYCVEWIHFRSLLISRNNLSYLGIIKAVFTQEIDQMRGKDGEREEEECDNRYELVWPIISCSLTITPLQFTSSEPVSLINKKSLKPLTRHKLVRSKRQNGRLYTRGWRLNKRRKKVKLC